MPADPEATERLRAWLAAQLPPFAPDDVEVTDAGVLVSSRHASAPETPVTTAWRRARRTPRVWAADPRGRRRVIP
ncbi:hypothetical protein GCM10027261_32940 [Geodermatophilus arenarius]|uniref:Uncharacterized protein n=1 Tax=Geodermatophilus arenarius TaxID=1137990 RepID=A0ABV9LMW1_9ACTN